MVAQCLRWVIDRFGLKPIWEKIFARRIPKAPWYFGDGATLMTLFMVLVLTGTFMAFSYSPSTDEAFESVLYITEQLPLGKFVRAVHYWSAGIIVVMLVLHMFRQILLGGYKPPREATWLVGVILFFLIITMSFTGYVLRWDERGIYAIRVALNIIDSVPFVGESLVAFVQGGPDLGTRTLSRVYSIHVIIIPLCLFALLGLHLYLVVLHGVTTNLERRIPIATADEQRKLYDTLKKSEETSEKFFPTTMSRSGIVLTTVMLLVLLLAILNGPAELFPRGNLTDISTPIEEWWFWWYSSLIAIIPNWMLPAFFVGFPTLVFIILMSLPFIDRGPNRGLKKRPVALISVLLMVVALLYLSDLRRRSPWTGWPTTVEPPLPQSLVLSKTAQEGFELYVKNGCTSCHAISGYGRNVGSDLAAMDRPYSIDELVKYISRPPPGVSMPAYEEQMTADEIQLVSEFVLVVQTLASEEIR